MQADPHCCSFTQTMLMGEMSDDENKAFTARGLKVGSIGEPCKGLLVPKCPKSSSSNSQECEKEGNTDPTANLTSYLGFRILWVYLGFTYGTSITRTYIYCRYLRRIMDCELPKHTALVSMPASYRYPRATVGPQRVAAGRTSTTKRTVGPRWTRGPRCAGHTPRYNGPTKARPALK